MDKKSLIKILKIFQNNIIPLTVKGVSFGNKIFGAAILRKKDFSLVAVGSNNEIENPLWHGEVNTINEVYKIPLNKRPNSKECIFISSHEPCSLCLSAITWCGFDNFYYLFPYEQTYSTFKIPHDLKILKEVFNINNGIYRKNNKYWKSYCIKDLINKLPDREIDILLLILNPIINSYKKLSEKYQIIKNENEIPLK